MWFVYVRTSCALALGLRPHSSLRENPDVNIFSGRKYIHNSVFTAVLTARSLLRPILTLTIVYRWV